MSLNFDASKLKDPDIAWTGDASSVLCNAIVPSLIFIDIVQITEDNADEVYARLHMLEQICGANRRKVGENSADLEPVYITPEEVESFIGLTCNVMTENRSSFYSGIVKGSLDEYKRNYQHIIRSNSRENEL